jgi:hypothetical protein
MNFRLTTESAIKHIEFLQNPERLLQHNHQLTKNYTVNNIYQNPRITQM